MALAEDLGLHISLHMEALKSLRHGVPSGLPLQFAELSAMLAAYDADVANLEKDTHLSAVGKAAKIKAAYDQVAAATDKWRASKTTGIDAQTAAHRAKLQSQADKLVPAPTDFQVQNMVERLSAFDPLEVEILYADANDAERRIIEAAADAIGRQPRKHGEHLTWEPLIPAERVTAVVAERLERSNPEVAAALRDSQRIRGTYDALAGAAQGLLRDSLPALARSAPAV